MVPGSPRTSARQPDTPLVSEGSAQGEALLIESRSVPGVALCLHHGSQGVERYGEAILIPDVPEQSNAYECRYGLTTTKLSLGRFT